MRMKHAPVSSARRRAVNVSLDEATVMTAKEMGINISKACQEALDKEIRRERDRKWNEDNREAIAANNAWVEEHGLPLARYRLF